MHWDTMSRLVLGCKSAGSEARHANIRLAYTDLQHEHCLEWAELKSTFEPGCFVVPSWCSSLQLLHKMLHTLDRT